MELCNWAVQSLGGFHKSDSRQDCPTSPSPGYGKLPQTHVEQWTEPGGYVGSVRGLWASSEVRLVTEAFRVHLVENQEDIHVAAVLALAEVVASCGCVEEEIQLQEKEYTSESTIESSPVIDLTKKRKRLKTSSANLVSSLTLVYDEGSEKQQRSNTRMADSVVGPTRQVFSAINNERSVTCLFMALGASCAELQRHATDPVVFASLLKASGTRRLTALPLVTATEMFLRSALNIRRLNTHLPFSLLKDLLISVAQHFSIRIARARNNLGAVGCAFVKHQKSFLTLGRSSCVESLLESCAIASPRQIACYICCPADNSEFKNDIVSWAAKLCAAGIDAIVVDSSAVTPLLHRVDACLVGAEAVVESGGIVNRIGTGALCQLAKSTGVPVYVACEAYKFCRRIPPPVFSALLDASQPFASYPRSRTTSFNNSTEQPKIYWTDESRQQLPPALSTDQEVAALFAWTAVDFVRPEYLDLLITDLGIFTPSGVSDEIASFYQAAGMDPE